MIASILSLEADQRAAASPLRSFLVLNSVDVEIRSISSLSWSTSNWSIALSLVV